MAKTYIHDMQIPLYSENLNYAEVAQWRKPISMSCKYRFIAKTQTKPKPCRGCPMAKTYIHVMQMTLHSENLNHAEVAQWRKPISMSCKYRFIAKT